MNFIWVVIFFLIIYVAFNAGKIVGRTESFFKKPSGQQTQNVKKNNTNGIEEADFEEVEEVEK